MQQWPQPPRTAKFAQLVALCRRQPQLDPLAGYVFGGLGRATPALGLLDAHFAAF